MKSKQQVLPLSGSRTGSGSEKIWHYGDFWSRFLCEFPMILADFLLPKWCGSNRIRIHITDSKKGTSANRELSWWGRKKCNFYVQKYDIMVIYVDSYASFLWFLLIFATRIRINASLIRIRIRVAKMTRIRPDPDPYQLSLPRRVLEWTEGYRKLSWWGRGFL